MKSIIKKINLLGLVALFVAGGMALAFTPKSPELNNNDVLWGRTTSGWIATTPSASCSPGDHPCKMLFPEGQDPNLNEDGGIPLDEENGYVTAP